MKTSKRSFRAFYLLGSLMLLFILFAGNFAQADDNMNFSISTNLYYFPGDAIKLNINSYDYNKKGSGKLKLKFTIYKIKDITKFYSEQKNRYGLDVLGKDDINLTYLCSEVSNFSDDFSYDNNYGYKYIQNSVDINIKEKGAYLIKADDNKRVAYCGFIISDLGMAVKTGSNSLLSYTVNRKDGTPIDNADLTYYEGSDVLGTGRSVQGISQIKFDSVISNNEHKAPLIIGTIGNDVVVSDAYLYFGYEGNRYTVYTFTQQPVYRAGATVNFKSTIRESSPSGLKSFANKNVRVSAKDQSNVEFYKAELNTNENGSIDGSFKLNDDAKTGTYYIYIQIDEQHTYTSEFTIEQYKKPEYKVSVTTDKAQYTGKELLKGTVQADYYFGSPVTNANVTYSIYKVQYYRPWWEFSEYAWWYEDYYASYDKKYQYNSSTEIYSGTGKVDNSGKFNFDFNLNEDFKIKRNNEYDYWYYNDQSSDYKYIIRAEVTDASGRNISNTTTALVTRGQFYLSASADKYLVKPGDKVIFNVISKDFADKPVKTDFEINISKYNYTSGNGKYDAVTTIKGSTNFEGKGLASYEIPSYSGDGYYSAEVVSFDAGGNKITTTTNFSVYDKEYSWYDNSSRGMQIITDKESYKIGEVCHALISTVEPGMYALITTSNTDIVSSRVEKFVGKSAFIDIPITSSYTSNFTLEADYIKNSSIYSATKNILVIPEEKFLTVQIDPSKLEYKPKESGEVKVRVLDNQGNPVKNAEVSIGVVDESIYAIKEDATKDIRKFFYPNAGSSVNTSFNNYNISNGSSRLLSIYERYNLYSLNDKDLATIKGTVVDKDGKPVSGASIMVDEDYYAAVSNVNGNFEFKVPAGDYEIGLLIKKKKNDNVTSVKIGKGEIKELRFTFDRENEVIISTLNGGVMLQKTGRVNDTEAPMDTKKMAPTTETNRSKDDERQDKTKSKEEMVAPELRSDFRDAIEWSPYTITDNNGYASVIVKYPDDLTTWRIVSRVITSDTKVGQSAKTVLTRKDLLVRLEAPRFIQQGDETEIKAIVHNYLKTDKNVKVKFRSDSLKVTGESSVSENIAANGEHIFSWKVKSISSLGLTKLYVEALTNEESDAVEISIPVQPKGLQINLPAIADVSDQNSSKEVEIYIPEGTDISSVMMKFTTAPSIAGTLLTSLDELAGYPYGCVEQTMSRFMPTVIVANTFRELNLPMDDKLKNELPKYVESGMQRLYGYQHSDGGWGWWENDETNPFMTAWVVNGMRIAKESGFKVDENSWINGFTALKNMTLSQEQTDPSTEAYMLYVVSLVIKESDKLNLTSQQSINNNTAAMFKNDTKAIKEKLDKLISKDINNSAKAYSALAYNNINDNSAALKLVNELEAASSSSDAFAFWEGKSWHYNWQDDKVQTTAITLKALLEIKSNSTYIDKAVRWLMTQRQGNAWRSTQETATIIYAVTDYLKLSNELTPDETVDVQLNGKNIFHSAFGPSDVFRKNESIIVKGSSLQQGMNKISISKTGTGKAYFSSNTIFYTTDVKARENGFRIEREYFKLEKYSYYNEDKITYRKKYFDGELKSGDILLVRIKVYSKDNDVNYFMLEDPIPTGCEVIKDDWAYKIDDENSYNGGYNYNWRWWYADKDVRDDKINFFATYMNSREAEFSYLVRAETPGSFNINPSRGMLMYYPEVNGNSFDNYIRIAE